MPTLVLLLIEFVDELVFGVTEAVWPLIRSDLHLNYVQIGVALSLPGVIGNMLEPLLGILGDVWKRRLLILGGGIFFTLACFLTAISRNNVFLLVSFIVFYPASGAFVSLSQATLMDIDPARHEHNMARWTFAGSVGVVLGPLLLGLFNSGWYAILQGNLYSSLPGQSGTVIALKDITGLFGKLLPFGIGLAAEHFGLGSALWILLAGPIALLIGLPHGGRPLLDGSG